MFYTVIDVETTGTDPLLHEICEITLILIDKNFNELGRFTSTIRPEHFNRIDPEALKVNKFTVEELQTFPSLVQVRGALLSWKRQAIGEDTEENRFITIGHNVGFDLEFMRQFLQYRFDSWFTHRKVDTKVLWDTFKLFGSINPNMSGALDKITKRLGIPHNAHKSYDDCIATIALLKWFKSNLSLDVKDLIKNQ